MAAAVRKLGNFPTHNYNALYSAVLDTLNVEIPKIQGAAKGLTRKEALGLINQNPSGKS